MPESLICIDENVADPRKWKTNASVQDFGKGNYEEISPI